jgi:broad specificity phosphatase PhoE
LLEGALPTSLLLLCAGGTRSSRIGGFSASDEPLDEGGVRVAARCLLPDRFRANVLVSPMRSSLETAAALELDVRQEPALSDIDHGAWAGRSFDEIHSSEPEAFSAWIADPSPGAPGGESMEAAKQRVGEWLDRMAPADAPICGITHATIIRAALAHAIDIPLHSTLSIDIAPLSRVMLSFNRRWRLTLGSAD